MSSSTPDYRKIGTRIVDYFLRHRASLYIGNLTEEELVELGKVASGDYQLPCLTAREFYDISRRLRSRFRCHVKYPLGPYFVVYRDQKGNVLRRKSDFFSTAEIDQLRIKVTRKVTLDGEEITWVGIPPEDNLLLVVLALPREISL